MSLYQARGFRLCNIISFAFTLSTQPDPYGHATMACRYCRDDISLGGVGAARQKPFKIIRHRAIIITSKLHSVQRFASRPRDAPPENGGTARKRNNRATTIVPNIVFRLSGI